MAGFGLNPGRADSEVRVDFRSRLLDRVLRLAGAMIPGASLALVLGAFALLRQQPQEGFGLLRQWGAWWVVVLVIGYWIWSLGMRLIDKLEKLATGVQDSAVSIARLADRDDRERDRMLTETAFVGSTVQKLAGAVSEMRGQLERVEAAVVRKQGG